MRQIQFSMEQSLEASDACAYVSQLMTRGDAAVPHERLRRLSKSALAPDTPSLREAEEAMLGGGGDGEPSEEEAEGPPRYSITDLRGHGESL